MSRLPLEERIKKALRKFEEFEIQVLLGTIAVIVVLDLLGWLPERLLPPLMLASLGVLGGAMLRVRVRMEDVIVHLSRASQAFFHDRPAHDIRAAFRNSKAVLLSGTTLTRTLRNHMADLEYLVSSGGQLKVLLLDPDSPFSMVSAMRSSQASYQSHQADFIRASLRDAEFLLALPGGSVEVRVSQYPFAFGAILVDPDTPNASLHLRYYTYRPGEGEGPYFNLYPSDRPWYQHFRNELEALWRDAGAFKPSAPNSAAEANE